MQDGEVSFRPVYSKSFSFGPSSTLSQVNQQHYLMITSCDSHQLERRSTAVEELLALIVPFLPTCSSEPIHDEETRKFVGEFVVSTEQPERRDAAATRGSQAIRRDSLGTPTRASLGGMPARNSGDLALQLSSASKTASVPACPSHLLEPSEINLTKAAKKLQWLEAEKQRREMLIQELYDELSELWAKFDVPEEEMDAFVMESPRKHNGCHRSVSGELEKMKQLKAQHMSLFITKTRERIATLWDPLFLTDEETRGLLPSLLHRRLGGDADPSLDEPLPTDEILASHEQMIDHLTEPSPHKGTRSSRSLAGTRSLLDESKAARRVCIQWRTSTWPRQSW